MVDFSKPIIGNTSAGKVIVTEQPASDIFGGVASVAKGIFGAMDENRQAKSAAAASARANDANAREQARFDLEMSDRNVKNELAIKKHEIFSAYPQFSDLDRMKRGVEAGDVTAMELTLKTDAAMAEMLNKHPENAAVIQDYANTLGLTQPAYREAQYALDEQAMRDAANIAREKTWLDAAAAAGYNPDDYGSQAEYAAKGRVLVEAKERLAANKAQAEAKAAETTAQRATAKWEDDQRSDDNTDDILKIKAAGISPLLRTLGQTTAAIGDDASLLMHYRSIGPELKNNIEMERAVAISEATIMGVNADGIAKINSTFDTFSGIVDTAMTGELSKTQMTIENLKLMEANDKLMASRAAPELMRIMNTLGPATVNDFLKMAASHEFASSPLGDTLVNGFVDVANGRQTKNAKDYLDFENNYAETSRDVRAMDKIDPDTVEKMVKYDAQALPSRAKEFINNPTSIEASNAFGTSAVRMFYAAKNAPTNTTGRQYGLNVASRLASDEVLRGIELLETTDPNSAKTLRMGLSSASAVAIQSLKNATAAKSSGLFRGLAVAKPGIRPNRDEFGTQKLTPESGKNLGEPIKFDPAQNKFVATQVWTTSYGNNPRVEYQAEVDAANKLLDVWVAQEEALGTLPPELGTIGEKRMYLATQNLSEGAQERFTSRIETTQGGTPQAAVQDTRAAVVKGIEDFKLDLRTRTLGEQSMVPEAAWKRFQQDIDIGEGTGGDYDTLLGHQQDTQFLGTKVSEMSIGQLLEFSKPDGKYAQYSKEAVGRIATPMGRYQIVGTTLRQAAKELGLPDDTIFTPEVQDRIAEHLWMGRLLRGEPLDQEWEGLKDERFGGKYSKK